MTTVHLVTIDPGDGEGMQLLLRWCRNGKLRGVPDPGGGSISIKFTPKGLIGELDDAHLIEAAEFGSITVHGSVEL